VHITYYNNYKGRSRTSMYVHGEKRNIYLYTISSDCGVKIYVYIRLQYFFKNITKKSWFWRKSFLGQKKNEKVNNFLEIGHTGCKTNREFNADFKW
jgi:hypothetical protein